MATHLKLQDQDLGIFLGIFSLGKELNLKIIKFVTDITSHGSSQEAFINYGEVIDEPNIEASDEDSSASDLSPSELTDEYCDSDPDN